MKNRYKNYVDICAICGTDITYEDNHKCSAIWDDRFKMKVELKGESMTKNSDFPSVRSIDKNEEEIMLTESQLDIIRCMDSMKEFLLEKNRRYGDSALHPKRVFSKATTDEQLLVRLDDKISRVQNSTELRRNDCVDILGYLTLVCVSKGWTDFKDLLD